MIPYSFAPYNVQRDRALHANDPARDLNDLFLFLHQACLMTPASKKKSDCHRFIPSVFENGKRNLENFKKTRILAIDIDNIIDEELFFKDIESLEENEFGYILHGTPSHDNDNPRYRMFMELHTDCLNYTEYARSYKETISSLLPNAQFEKKIKSGYSIDMAVKHAASFFYIPQEDKLDTFIINKGKPVKLTPINPNKPQIKNEEDLVLVDLDMQRIKGKDEVESDLDDILLYLEENNLTITESYTEWLNIGYACVSLKYNGFSQKECLELFERFSLLDRDCATPEEIETQFNACHEGTHNRISISSLFYAARKEGWNRSNDTPFEEKIGMVEAKGGNKVHLVYKNPNQESLLQISQEIYNPAVAQAHICNAQDATYELKATDVMYENKDGDLKRKAIPDFLSMPDFKTPQPEGVEFLLGAAKKGTYYNMTSNTISYAKHCIAPAIPKFSKEIHEWIQQLPIATDWMYTYLYNFTDLTVAVPGIQFYGESNAGKSLFVILASTLHTGGGVTNGLEDTQFDSFAGTTPLRIYEEKPPQDAAELKRLITMYRTQTDQKFDGRMLTIIGYFRVIIAVNEPFFNLPGDANADKAALLRRIQPIEMKKEHADYL